MGIGKILAVGFVLAVLLAFVIALIYSSINMYKIITRTNRASEIMDRFFDEYSEYIDTIVDQDIKDDIFRRYSYHIPALMKKRRNSTISTLINESSDLLT
jgi:hypothetical protein